MYRLGKAQERLDELQKQVTQETLFSLDTLCLLNIQFSFVSPKKYQNS